MRFFGNFIMKEFLT